MRFHWTEKLLPFESVPEKKRTRFLLAETRCFKNFGLPLITIMVSKKNVNERISSPLKRKSVAADCNKGFI